MPCWHRESNRGTAILNLTLGDRWGGVVNATSQPYTGLFGHRVGLDGYGEENISFLTGEVRTPNRPARRSWYIDHAVTKTDGQNFEERC